MPIFFLYFLFVADVADKLVKVSVEKLVGWYGCAWCFGELDQPTNQPPPNTFYKNFCETTATSATSATSLFFRGFVIWPSATVADGRGKTSATLANWPSCWARLSFCLGLPPATSHQPPATSHRPSFWPRLSFGSVAVSAAYLVVFSPLAGHIPKRTHNAA